MSSGDLSRVRELFLQACQLPPEERDRFLERVCGADTDLRGDIESLLWHDQEGGTRATAGGAARLSKEPEPERPPKEVGPYRIREKLGQGGMGVVYRAERTRPFRQEVALKLIRSGMGSRQIVARFEHERQALALMDHPHIAKVHDAGVHSDGRPYFAMEYVQGAPITDFCDMHRLTIRQRLELMERVCLAVQHAHEQGVIHRDLTPSNVMVTLVDDEPQPRIIDFGVAKAVGQRLTEQSLVTGIGPVGTPAYMSPEQAEVEGPDVNTRSDIYSLGVILYELLTGSRPFGQADPVETLRRIREEDPPRPSTRLSGLGVEVSSEVAERRGVSRHTILRELRGDLDWIAMKAMEKDRDRRYESAFALAADVRRYLEHEPVVAGPPGAWYRTAKYLRRNRAAVTVVAVVAASVVLAFGYGLRARLAALRQSEKVMTRLTELMTELRETDDPAAIDRQVQTLFGSLADRPETGAAVRWVLVDHFRRRGWQREAREHLEALVDHYDLREPADRTRRLDALAELTELYKPDRQDEALALAREVVEGRRLTLGPNHPETIRSVTGLVLMLGATGSAIDENRGQESLAEAHAMAAGIAGTLADPMRGERADQLLPVLDDVTYRLVDELGVLHPVSRTWFEHATELYPEPFRSRRGAIAFLVTQLASLEGLRSSSPPASWGRVLATMASSETLFRQDLPVQAETLLRDELRRAEDLENQTPLAPIRYQLGRALEIQQRNREANELFDEAAYHLEGLFGPLGVETVMARKSVARTHLALDELNEAEAVFRSLLETLDIDRSPHPVHRADVLIGLGKVLRKKGDPVAAEPLLRRGLTQRRELFEADDHRIVAGVILLGGCCGDLESFDEAESLLLDSHGTAVEGSGRTWTERETSAARELIALYEAWRRFDEAAVWRQRYPQ
jgi:serine/threonine protein kinase/tetratricopeptide (TPR) repeat protein